MCVRVCVSCVSKARGAGSGFLLGSVENPFLLPPAPFQLSILPRNDSLTLTLMSSSQKEFGGDFFQLVKERKRRIGEGTKQLDFRRTPKDLKMFDYNQNNSKLLNNNVKSLLV